MNFLMLFGLCSFNLAFSQTVSSNSIDAGSLNGTSVSGSISSTIGEFVAGSVGDEFDGSISQGFSQSYISAAAPLQLMAIARVATNTWSALLGTGFEIEVCNLNGSVLQRIPQGISQQNLVELLQGLQPSVYVLRSGTGSQQARMIFSPTIR